jgi:hypothetical protein
MSAAKAKNPESPELNFIRESDTQSTCAHCSEIVRVSTALCLKFAEETHSDFCAALPQKALMQI